MLPLTKVVKVTMMRLRRRYNVMLELKMRASQLKHPVDVVEEVIKKPGKAFVLITVLNVNVFREYKVAATNVDARIVITLMEKEWLTKLKRLAESEENTTTPPKPPVTSLQIMGEEFPRNLWNDYDNLILQIVYSQVAFGEQEPDYDRLYETFLFVFKLTGSTNTSVQSKDKVTRIIKNILVQRKLVISSLQREMERSWSS
jgi:hypothetical protein